MKSKRQAFILEYLKDFNGSQAAIRAGYSENASRAVASRLLTNANIQTEIQRLISERGMGKDEVLQRLADQARGDLADLMDITPAGYTFRLMTRDGEGNLVTNPKTKLIKRIKQKVTTYLAKKDDGEDREIIETELELYDAQNALQLLGKHHRLFVDRTSVEDPDGRPLGSALTELEAALKKSYEDKDAGNG